MHELSLAAEIIDLIAPKVPRREKLTRVYVTVGPLSGVWPDALQLGFDEIARQNGFVNARMVIERPEARFKCTDCGEQYSSDSAESVCPHCGSPERSVLAGEQFTVDSIEVEE
ncbi:MAG: hypothetical protein GF331_21150 [Chitinivibrionales bacterium]|nr:hypothetical protein [Chitinivibrionales bacterium]